MSVHVVDEKDQEAKGNADVSVGLSLGPLHCSRIHPHHIRPPIEVEVGDGPNPPFHPICCPYYLFFLPIDRGSCRSRRLVVGSLRYAAEQHSRLWGTVSGLRPVRVHLDGVMKPSSGWVEGHVTSSIVREVFACICITHSCSTQQTRCQLKSVGR